MDIVSFLNINWPVMAAIGAGFVWIMKLQGRVDILEVYKNTHDQHREDVQVKMEQLNNTLITVLQSVSELKGVILGKEQK